MEIYDEQRRVCRLQSSGEPRHRVIGRDGGKVDKLEVNILVRHHPGLRMLGGEGVRRGVGAGAGESSMERRFARVRGPEQRDLRRAVPVRNLSSVTEAKAGVVDPAQPAGSKAERARGIKFPNLRIPVSTGHRIRARRSWVRKSGQRRGALALLRSHRRRDPVPPERPRE
jgi:hypothetical protein